MTVVVAPDWPASPSRPGIFLAGGISGVGDWQRDAIERLRPAWPVIYNPRRAIFPMGADTEGTRQIRWEFDQLALADAILFWFSHETVQPIVLYELGRWAASGKPLAVGADPDYERRFDVVQQLGLARPGLTVHADLESTCAAANELALAVRRLEAEIARPRNVADPGSTCSRSLRSWPWRQQSATRRLPSPNSCRAIVAAPMIPAMYLRSGAQVLSACDRTCHPGEG
jgi:hypothetical protein